MNVPAPDSRVSPPSLRSSQRLLAGCILVVVLASLFASLIQNSGGRVRVRSITLPTHNGQWVTADLFRPLSATSEKPAPLVVVVPGFQRSKETQANISLELARRGIVVIAIDPYAQGSSSSSVNPRSATNEGYGMFSVVDYVANTDNLNYVDKSRIGVTGHSAGGNAAIQAAAYFGTESRKNGTPSKVHSIFVSGYVLTLTDKLVRNFRSNAAISYALYDEGAYRNEKKNGDMRSAPEALRLVQSGLGATEKITEVEIGRFYGDAAARNLRVVYNEPLLHPFQPYSPEATTNQIAYFQQVFGLTGSLPASDQVWYWKELFCALALIAALVAVVPLARLIVHQVPYFNSLVYPVPAPAPRPQGRGLVVFWTLFAAGAVIACFSYIPMTDLSQKLFVEASGREPTWFFPQRMNNGVMLWAAFNGLAGFGLFYLGHRLHGKSQGATPAGWGIQTSARELARTFLLAALIFGAFYLLLFAVYTVFHVDYRLLFLGVRVFQPELLLLVPVYVPVFFIFFLSNSLRANNSLRLAGQPEWRSLLLAGIGNSLGLFLILLLQYATFALTGTVYWTDGWLYINLLFAVVPMMFVLPYFNRAFFRITGRIYLGPMTTCLIFIMIMLSNTVCYLPL